MEEKIGRETLQQLLQLQISLLDKYIMLLGSTERTKAKKAVGEIVKAIVAAVPDVVTFEKLAYNHTVTLHEEAVAKTRELLEKLLKEEQARAGMHEKTTAEAEGRRQTS